MRPLFVVLALAVAACHAEAAANSVQVTDPRMTERAESAAMVVHQAADRFLFERKRCPADVKELLTSDLIKSIPKDPWGAEIALRCDGKVADGISAGPDGKHGTDDDISAVRRIALVEMQMQREQKS